MKRQWTVEEANTWYRKYPWIRGTNFLPSNCSSRLDMWQSYHLKEHLECSDRELALAEQIGFNSVRLWLNFDVYYSEGKETFLDILEKYICLCAKHHQSVMLCLAYEEDLHELPFVPKPLGEQPIYPATHFNRPKEKEGKPSWRHYLEIPETHDLFIEMVTEVVRKYRDDERIIVWNVWNEPDITRKEATLPLLAQLFELVRSLDPIQPLTSDIWAGLDEECKCKSVVQQYSLEHSDVISFHNYSPYEKFIEQVIRLKSVTDRPIFMTEWLHRINHNNVYELYPLMYLENIACYCWGFVAGLTATIEPWNSLWDQYDKDHNVPYDFTKWQHDLFRPNGRPYDPKEIEIIKHFNELADKKFKQ